MSKIIALKDIPKVRQDKILVTTNGTFDILHVGHLRILQQAKTFGDILLVLVNSDSSVQHNKGPQRPIIPLKERMEMLTGLACVDYVMSFEEPDVLHSLELIQPNFHIKGGTFISERIVAEQQVLAKYGGIHICLDLVGNYSTTQIIEKIKSSITNTNS